MKRIFLLAMTTAVFVALSSAAFAQADKMSADDIVAKHLASIGTAEDIAAVKTLIFSGDGSLGSVLGNTALTGQSQFGSEGSKMVFAVVFNSSQHPYDKVAYDGKTQTVGYPNGQASVLSTFIKAQPAMMKYGIFGGTLSTAWGLLDTKGKKIKLDFGGLVKIEDKQLYKLKFSPGNDLRISLYFEPDTFRHVRTEYEYTIQAAMNSSDPTQASSSKQSHYKLVEQFSDFKAAGKLTLPHDYTIKIDSIEPNAGRETKSFVWHMQYRDVYFNEPFQEGTFKVG